MANPLRWFRRHAKVLMVVLGSAAMAIFGLGPVFDTLSRPSQFQDREVEIVAKWNGGDITRTELDAMQIRYFQTQRFLEALRSEAVAKKGDEFRSLAQPIPPIQMGQQFQQSMVDEQLIERMMLAQKAEEEGVVVSDGVLDDYLALASGDAGFSRNDLEQINRDVNQNGCSLENIRRHLKIELLAMQMRMYSMAGMTMIPNPLESMQLYARATERIECQVLPISVEQYVSKIDAEPSKSELKKIYEEGKYDFPDPTGKKPGFKRRDKVKLEYLVGELETFIQNEMNKLTDEQVQAKYESLLEEKSDLVMEPIPDAAEDSIKITDPPPALPNEDKQNSGDGGQAGPDADSVDPPPALTEPEKSQTESDPPKTEEGKSNTPDSEAKTEAAKSATEKASEGSSAGATGDEKTDDKNESGDQSINVVQNRYQFVSLRQEETESSEATAQESGAENKTETKTAGDDATAQAGTGGQESDAGSSQSASTSDPEAVQKTPATDESVGPSATVQVPDQTTDIQPLVESQQPETKKRPRPLKDVADAVKRSMVEADARKAMEEAVKKATVKMMSYYTVRLKWEFKNEKDRGEPPEPIDIKALAQQYNLVANETSLVTETELAEETVGRIIVPMTMRQAGFQPQTQYRLIAELIFDRFDALKPYDPQDANDLMTGNMYVYWLSEKVEAKIPEYEVCEAEVIKYWKSQRAIELAMEEAEKIAAQVNGEGKLLSELYGEKASETGQFSWFTNFGSTNIGRPAEVKDPDNEFMEAVFSIKEKLKAVAAPNQGKDIVYVVQLTSDRQPIAELGNEYLDDNYFRTKSIPPQVQNVSRWYVQELAYDWNQEFADSMGLKFIGR